IETRRIDAVADGDLGAAAGGDVGAGEDRVDVGLVIDQVAARGGVGLERVTLRVGGWRVAAAASEAGKRGELNGEQRSSDHSRTALHRHLLSVWLLMARSICPLVGDR